MYLVLYYTNYFDFEPLAFDSGPVFKYQAITANKLIRENKIHTYSNYPPQCNNLAKIDLSFKVREPAIPYFRNKFTHSHNIW